MKYLKNVYYLNTAVNNKRKAGEIHDDSFYDLLDLLVDNKEVDVYEVGMEFGQRLSHIESEGVSVVGGVEFDKTFSIYTKHVDLKNRGWKLDYSTLDNWVPNKMGTVIAYNLLDNLEPQDVKPVLEKLKYMSKTLYVVTKLKLDLPKEGNVYVYRAPNMEVDKPITSVSKPVETTKKKDKS